MSSEPHAQAVPVSSVVFLHAAYLHETEGAIEADRCAIAWAHHKPAVLDAVSSEQREHATEHGSGDSAAAMAGVDRDGDQFARSVAYYGCDIAGGGAVNSGKQEEARRFGEQIDEQLARPGVGGE